MIDKGVCDKGYAWNPSNCKCECDKLCDAGEYFDYENCKCRSSFIWTCEWVCMFLHSFYCLGCNSLNIGIGAYFTYKYIKCNKENVSIYDYIYQAKSYWSYKIGVVKQINIKNRTYYLYNDMINIKNFDPILLKIDWKSDKNIGIYNIGYNTIKNIDDFENIYSVNLLYLLVNHAGGYIEEKGVNKYLIFDSTDENKELLKRYNDV